MKTGSMSAFRQADGTGADSGAALPSPLSPPTRCASHRAGRGEVAILPGWVPSRSTLEFAAAGVRLPHSPGRRLWLAERAGCPRVTAQACTRSRLAIRYRWTTAVAEAAAWRQAPIEPASRLASQPARLSAAELPRKQMLSLCDFHIHVLMTRVWRCHNVQLSLAGEMLRDGGNTLCLHCCAVLPRAPTRASAPAAAATARRAPVSMDELLAGSGLPALSLSTAAPTGLTPVAGSGPAMGQEPRGNEEVAAQTAQFAVMCSWEWECWAVGSLGTLPLEYALSARYVSFAGSAALRPGGHHDQRPPTAHGRWAIVPRPRRSPAGLLPDLPCGSVQVRKWAQLLSYI